MTEHECREMNTDVEITTESEYYPDEWAMVIGRDEYWQIPINICPFCGQKL